MAIFATGIVSLPEPLFAHHCRCCLCQALERRSLWAWNWFSGPLRRELISTCLAVSQAPQCQSYGGFLLGFPVSPKSLHCSACGAWSWWQRANTGARAPRGRDLAIWKAESYLIHLVQPGLSVLSSDWGFKAQSYPEPVSPIFYRGLQCVWGTSFHVPWVL